MTGLGRAPPAPTVVEGTRFDGPQSSPMYLLARLALIEARVRLAVERRRARDPDPDDPVRGLYVDDRQVDALLAGEGASLGLPPAATEERRSIEADADVAEAAGADLRLRRLRRAFGLDEADLDILLTALAPDLDGRYERLYAYLHDDIARRRASTGLALEIVGASPADVHARSRLAPDGPLAGASLLTIEDADRPLLTRALRVPDRVTAFLLGGDLPDAAVATLMTDALDVSLPGGEPLVRALAAGVDLAYLHDRSGGSGATLAAHAVADSGRAVLHLDLGRLPASREAIEVAALAARESALAGAGLVAGPLEAVDRSMTAEVVRALAGGPAPTVLTGGLTWEPGWSDRAALQVEVPVLDLTARERVWAGAFRDVAPGFDPNQATSQFRLTPQGMDRAARSAVLRAAADGGALGADHLRAAVREQNAGRLERLARRIEPAAGFTDVVLPARALAALREIIDRARHRHRVLDEWGLGRGTARRRGITALFAGESGTGKTLSAEVVAAALGLDLYAIDLSAVVDKYIGETEKNLERIFDEAEGVNGVLFFDEADALFGKRSEVSDAHDRYANIETAFLLQRMESFDGIAILATNLRANLDEAFTRRIDVLIPFPEPDEADRRRLWELHLPEDLPRGEDLDLHHLARTFKLTGGDIRNITLAAAYAAAADGGPLTMSHLLAATAREYRKLGRLVTDADFDRSLGQASVSAQDREPRS